MAFPLLVRRWRSGAVRSSAGFACVAVLFAACVGRADSPTPTTPAERAAKHVLDRVRLYRDDGLTEWLNQEAARLDRQRELGIANTSLIAELKAASPIVDARLLALLNQAVQKAETAVRNSGLSEPQLDPPADTGAPVLPEDVAAIDRERDRWLQVRAELIQNREILSEAVARRKADFAAAKSSRGTAIRWIIPTLSFVFFWAAVGYAHLPWWRRSWERHRGWWPLAVLGTWCLVSLAVLAGLDYRVFRSSAGPPLPSLPAPHDAASADAQQFALDLVRAERRAASASVEYDRAWMAWSDAVVQELPNAAELLGNWRQMRLAIRDASVSAATQAAIQEQISADLAETTAIAATVSAIQPTHAWIYGFAALLGIHWVFFAAGVAVRFRAKLFPRIFGRCPRCCATGKLRLEVTNNVKEYVCDEAWFEIGRAHV